MKYLNKKTIVIHCFSKVRQIWNVSGQSFHGNSYIHLEESFWLKFWSNVERFILKILCEVPYHRYGDSIAGTILLWPDVYIDTFLECLKSTAINNDLTEEGKYTMKQIYEYILIYKIHSWWDKEFLLALSSTFSHRCSLVPASSNQIKTLPGSLFYTCIDVLLGIFNLDFKNIDILLFLQCLHQLHSTLDSFILWISSRIRAIFASQNLFIYLIISLSDCQSVTKLLQAKTAVLVKNTDSFTKIPTLRLQREKILWNQMDFFTGCVAETPNLIHNFCFSVARDNLLHAANEHSKKKCVFYGQKVLQLDTIEELIYSLTEVVNLSDPLPLLAVISTAIAQSFLFVLGHLKNTISVKLIHFFECELSKFSQWLDKLGLDQDEKLKLKNLLCLRKVDAIFKCIQMPSPRSNIFSTRLNRVVPIADIGARVNEDLLTDEEKQFWQSMSSRNLLTSCFR